ncbi:MAG: Mini-ribonuclease 3 [Clostridia bacterium]|nr:Mini-ribonuclease 3 [Clostridia bacterium]
MSLRFERMMEEHEAAQMNALQLAYLGDSVWELIIRYDLTVRKLNVHNMHKNCVNMVNARSQSQILFSIYDILYEREQEIVRRGRNAHAKHPVPKNQNPDDYAQATGFEALFGYLYVTGQNERIQQLVNHMKEVNPDA